MIKSCSNKHLFTSDLSSFRLVISVNFRTFVVLQEIQKWKRKIYLLALFSH